MAGEEVAAVVADLEAVSWGRGDIGREVAAIRGCELSGSGLLVSIVGWM